MFRNLALVMIICGAFLNEVLPKRSYVQQITAFQSKIREGDNLKLHITGDLAYSNAFLLTNTLIINSWFLHLMQMQRGCMYYFLSEVFQVQCNHVVEALLLTMYVWFASKHRKPPDKQKSQTRRILDYVYDMIDPLEEFMFNKMNIELNIIQIIHFTTCIGMDILEQVVTSIIDVEFCNEDTEQTISDWNSEMF